MHRSVESRIGSRFTLLLVLLVSTGVAQAQNTAFTYQGRLTDNTVAANGSYDLQFKLYDTLSGGAQVGTTVTLEEVAVSAGVFSVSLDFGVAAFPGANRWLEIAVRLGVSTGAFTLLSPRHHVTSTPYSIKSLNAATADSLSAVCVNCVTGAQIGTLPLGSGNYIQNTTTQQATANFNIAGSGTATGTLSANTMNAASQYSLGGSRVLSAAGTANLFAGVGAGQANTSGLNNSFFGTQAGTANTQGLDNSYFGSFAGQSNMTGSANSFFGVSAGSNNSGSGNAFFGRSAGFQNSSASDNSFFGTQAGRDNSTGAQNSFFGRSAGIGNSSGFDNSFFGAFTGQSNTSGSANSFFGVSAGFNNTGSANAFFGRSAGFSNSLGTENSFFGAQAGRDNSAGLQNSFFGRSAGIGSTGSFNAFFGAFAGDSNTTGFTNSFFGKGAGSSNTEGAGNTVIGASADVGAGNLTFATAIGAGAVVTASGRVQIGRSGQDTVAIGIFASPSSSTPVCINASRVFTNCSSSLRYKERVQSWSHGLHLIQRLRPVAFTWKEGKVRDLGLIAEEVAAVEPLLITRNDHGEIEGVRYAQLNMALINAINEQQLQIAKQREQIERQESRLAEQNKEIESIKKLICLTNPQAGICK